MPGNDFYSIIYLESVVKDDISVLPKNIKTTIKNVIEKQLMVDPIGFGKPLQYSLKEYRRLRVG